MGRGSGQEIALTPAVVTGHTMDFDHARVVMTSWDALDFLPKFQGV
ncbi:MAG: hypothetical protein WBB85_11040 [Albidovulum sp.]